MTAGLALLAAACVPQEESGYIGVRFHRTVDESGVPVISRQELERKVSDLNDTYQKFGFKYQFFLQDIVDETGSELTEILSDGTIELRAEGTETRSINQIIDASGVIDVLIVDPDIKMPYGDKVDAERSANGYCHHGLFASSIVLHSDDGELVFSHEIGHYFGLNHEQALDNVMCTSEDKQLDAEPCASDDAEFTAEQIDQMNQNATNKNANGTTFILDAPQVMSAAMYIQVDGEQGQTEIDFRKALTNISADGVVEANALHVTSPITLADGLRVTLMGRDTPDDLVFMGGDDTHAMIHSLIEYSVQGDNSLAISHATFAGVNAIEYGGLYYDYEHSQYYTGNFELALNHVRFDQLNIMPAEKLQDDINYDNVVHFTGTTLTMRDVTIQDNVGGFSFSASSQVDLQNLKYIGNQGNLSFSNSETGDVSVRDFVFGDNQNSSLIFENAASLSLAGLEFYQNANSTSSDMAIQIENSDVVVVDGLHFYDNETGAMHISHSTATLLNATIEDNHTTSGALLTWGTSNVTVQESVIQDNLVGYGGIYYSGSHLSIIDSELTGNDTHDSESSQFQFINASDGSLVIEDSNLTGTRGDLINLNNTDVVISGTVLRQDDDGTILTVLGDGKTGVTVMNSQIYAGDRAHAILGDSAQLEFVGTTIVAAGSAPWPERVNITDSEVVFDHTTFVSDTVYYTCDFENSTIVVRGPSFTNSAACDDMNSMSEYDIGEYDLSDYFTTVENPRFGTLFIPNHPALLDAGDKTCPAPTDMLGHARPQGSACDIGAIERSLEPR